MSKNKRNKQTTQPKEEVLETKVEEVVEEVVETKVEEVVEEVVETKPEVEDQSWHSAEVAEDTNDTVEEVALETVEEVKDDYVPPVVETTVPETKPSLDVSVPTSNFDAVVNKRQGERYITGNKQVVVDILKAKVDKHFDYLAGRLGFTSVKQQEMEQLEFMEAVANINRADHETYCELTKYILEAISRDSKVFTDYTAFRFMKGLEAKANVNALHGYQNYMTYLSLVAVNWVKRHSLKTLVDINSVVKGLPKDAQANIVKLYNKLSNS